MEPSIGVTIVFKRVITTRQGFTYILSPPIVRIMGGGELKTPRKEVLTSKSMFGTKTAERELWWTMTASMYENITSISDALTTCYLLLESS